jgi:Ca-activated chloride channel family protein
VSAPLAALAERLGIDALEHPAWLPWFLLAAALAALLALRAGPESVGWPDAALLRAAGAKRADPVRGGGLLLRALALAALAAVLAGPVGVHQAPPEPGSGLDLVLAVDASGSMRALDAEVEGEPRTRLELAREVVARFARERAAEGDRVALVIFGDSAFTQCPLTSDGALLAAALGRVEAGIAGEATALGDALALAVKRLHAVGTGGAASRQLVVLLTDGRSNADSVPPDVAAALAAQLGIRVHTVGIGGEGEVAMATRSGGRSLETSRQDLDAETLTRIAAASGGRFFPARSSADLAAVYDAIDQSERASREAPAERLGQPAPEPLLAAAGLLLALELISARALGRRIP